MLEITRKGYLLLQMHHLVDESNQIVSGCCLDDALTIDGEVEGGCTQSVV